MRLYDPQGHLAQETPYFGASYGDLQKNEQQLTVNKPAAGAESPQQAVKFPVA